MCLWIEISRCVKDQRRWAARNNLFSGVSQRLIQIAEDVFDVFYAD